jgi:hypothetical protein
VDQTAIAPSSALRRDQVRNAESKDGERERERLVATGELELLIYAVRKQGRSLELLELVRHSCLVYGRRIERRRGVPLEGTEQACGDQTPQGVSKSSVGTQKTQIWPAAAELVSICSPYKPEYKVDSSCPRGSASIDLTLVSALACFVVPPSP